MACSSNAKRIENILEWNLAIPRYEFWNVHKLQIDYQVQ